MSTTTSSTGVAGTLSPALLVVLTAKGLVIPSLGQDAPHPLEPDDLHLLLELARGVDDPIAAVDRVVEQQGADRDALLRTVDALVERQRLLPSTGGARPTPPAGSPPVGSSPAGDEPVAAIDDDTPLVALSPVALAIRPDGFALHGVDGELIELLGADELVLLSQFRRPATVDQATTSLRRAHPTSSVHDPDLRRLVDRWTHRGALVVFDPDDEAMEGALGAFERLRRAELSRMSKLVRHVERQRDERRSQLATPVGKTAVFPVQSPFHYPHLALGLIFAYARVHRDGVLQDRYDLDPYWLVRKTNLRELLEERGPSVFLFSNYLWSSAKNLEMSALVKQWSPESITIHGGPDTPKFEGDNEQYFRENPHVDITVRTEGEVTTAEILEHLPDDLLAGGDLSALADVPGLSFRHGDRVVRTPDRERLADLDLLPSPYLTGLFDDFAHSTAPVVILETNRGCPYGCTFCDWGSATLSRIRKFSLDRVFDEIEWFGKNQMPRVFLADANFGIFERDVEIARRFAETKERYGYPLEFKSSYAKNTTKHLREIVRIMVDAGIATEGVLSLQSTDPATLEAVKRSNIKLEKYDELAATFRKEGLPLYSDLMIGLPGSSVAALDGDLQLCVDREIMARVFRTELLVNSPMNEPSYRALHDVTTEEVAVSELKGMVENRRKSLVVSTASYTAQDMASMLRHRQTFGIAESFGLLRHVARWVRQTTGRTETSFYTFVDETSRARPESYPLIAWTFDSLVEYSVAPTAWTYFFEEVRAMLVDDLGIAPGSEMDTVLAVQQALVPARGRTFPCSVELAHDYPAWFAAMLAAKDQGLDWCETVPALGAFGPGRLDVDDPTDVCRRAIGDELDLGHSPHWELSSPVSRPMPPEHVAI